MEVYSSAKSPADRALLGDFAVRQNLANRGDTDIDGCMDTTFAPVHQRWSGLWSAQQRAESAVRQRLVARDDAGRKLHRTLGLAHRQLQFTLGKDSPQLQMYLPEGRMAFATRALSEQISLLPPYITALVDGSCPLPESQRKEIEAAWQEALSCLQQAEAAQGDAREAQRARAAHDEEWDLAYRSYHRVVEYRMGGDRGLIQGWIKATSQSTRKTSPSTSAAAPA